MEAQQWTSTAAAIALLLSTISPDHTFAQTAGRGRASPQQAADAGQFAAAAQRVIESTSTSFQLNRGFAIDSSTRQALASEMTNFAVTYYQEPECGDVARGVNKAAAEALDAYLVDVAIQRRTKLTSFYARLAVACGSTSEASGWPSEGKNPFGIVTFPNGPRHLAKFTDSDGYIDYGTVDKGIVFTPGTYHLADIDDEGRPSALKRVTVSAGGSATLAGKIVVDAPQQQTLASAVLPPNYYCLAANQPVTQPEFGHRVSGPARGARPIPNQAAEFASLPAAVIDVSVTGVACSKECLDEIALLVARAIAGWRGVCQSCSNDSLIALKIAGKTFIDAAALESLDGKLAQKFPAAPYEALQKNALVLGSSRKFIALTSGNSGYQQLCNRETRSRPIWLTDARSILCDNGVSSTELRAAKLSLAFVPKITTCGPGVSDSFLACGTVDRGIEITLENARYSWRNPQRGVRLVLGTGSDEFDLINVVLHEVGHWMGLVDSPAIVVSSEGKQAIMADTYSRASCISAGDISSFAAAADTTWSGRLLSCSGLKRPSKTL